MQLCVGVQYVYDRLQPYDSFDPRVTSMYNDHSQHAHLLAYL